MTMKYIHRTPWLILSLLLFTAFPCRAQNTGTAAPPSGADAGPSDPELGESAQAVHALRDVKDKTLIFVFDVSGSMNTKIPGSDQTNLQRAREAAITILREGAGAGDRVVLMTFGAGYKKVFDTTILHEGDKEDLVQRVPSRTEVGEGTNIRKAHHEALKILDAALPKPGAVILLTDSYNDEPGEKDPVYAEYRKYYTPGGRLNKYPDTPENGDYERLLRKVERSQKVKMFGIGVQIDANGRPIERLPQDAPKPARAAPTFTPAVTTQGKQGPGVPWLWIGLSLVALLLALLVLLPLTKTSALRISGGPAGPKDFRVKHNDLIKLGGEGANFAYDAYPLPDVATPAASIKGIRGQFLLVPGTLPAPGAPPPKVFHNGLPLEQAASLNFGDEVRVSVPAPSGAGIARDFRLKFEDPKKSF